jgi:hypothetical protein
MVRVEAVGDVEDAVGDILPGLQGFASPELAWSSR